MKTAPRVGIDSISPTLMEDHSGAYIAWRRLKASNRILVHIDNHLDAEWVETSRLARVFTCRTLSELKSLERSPYDLRTAAKPLDLMNYVTFALRGRMVRELWWIVPERTLKGRFGFWRKVLLDSLKTLSHAEAQSIVFDGKVIRMSFQKTWVNVCALKDLPRFREPVLLDIHKSSRGLYWYAEHGKL